MTVLTGHPAAAPLARRIALTAGVLASAWLFTSCAQGRAETAGEVAAESTGAAPASGAAHVHHAQAAGEEALAPATDLSVYQLESTWRDQHEHTRQLRDLAGRPQAVAMVYTHCGSACPRIVGDLKRLEAEFPELGLVLVSIDPERDTPGRLREFAEGSGLGERWTLLNGDDGALMELAAVLGVRYRRVSDTEFMHSNLITVLDANGNIAYRQQGLGESAATAAALRQLPELVALR